MAGWWLRAGWCFGRSCSHTRSERRIGPPHSLRLVIGRMRGCVAESGDKAVVGLQSRGVAGTRDHGAMEQRRRKAAGLFARNCSAPDVARRLGVARQVAYRWLAAWRRGGRSALASKGAAGRKPKLTRRQMGLVTEALLAGPVARGDRTPLWTLPLVADLIKKLTGVRYHPGHVWRLLGASGFTWQRPEASAGKRDEATVGQWKRVRRPARSRERSTHTG